MYLKKSTQSKLTVIHNRYSSFVVDKSWKAENTHFSCQLCVLGLHERNTVLVRVVIDGLQFLQNFITLVTIVVVEENSKMVFIIDEHLQSFICVHAETNLLLRVPVASFYQHFQ